MSFFKKTFNTHTNRVVDDAHDLHIEPLPLENAEPSRNSDSSGKDIELAETERKGSVVLASGQEVTEQVANKRLSTYHKANRFDPNLGNDDLDEIEGVLEEHNAAGEGKAIDEFVENSPYPEVLLTVPLHTDWRLVIHVPKTHTNLSSGPLCSPQLRRRRASLYHQSLDYRPHPHHRRIGSQRPFLYASTLNHRYLNCSANGSIPNGYGVAVCFA